MATRFNANAVGEAWAPIAQIVRTCEHTAACMELHASGTGDISELTAKLYALDGLRNRMSELVGDDWDSHQVVAHLEPLISSAVKGDFYPLHLLMLAIMEQINAIEGAKLKDAVNSESKPVHVGCTYDCCAKYGSNIQRRPQ